MTPTTESAHSMGRKCPGNWEPHAASVCATDRAQPIARQPPHAPAPCPMPLPLPLPLPLPMLHAPAHAPCPCPCPCMPTLPGACEASGRMAAPWPPSRHESTARAMHSLASRRLEITGDEMHGDRGDARTQYAADGHSTHACSYGCPFGYDTPRILHAYCMHTVCILYAYSRVCPQLCIEYTAAVDGMHTAAWTCAPSQLCVRSSAT